MDEILQKVRDGKELDRDERISFFEHYRTVTGTTTRYNGCAAQIVNLVKELDGLERMPAVEVLTPIPLANQLPAAEETVTPKKRIASTGK